MRRGSSTILQETLTWHRKTPLTSLSAHLVALVLQSPASNPTTPFQQRERLWVTLCLLSFLHLWWQGFLRDIFLMLLRTSLHFKNYPRSIPQCENSRSETISTYMTEDEQHAKVLALHAVCAHFLVFVAMTHIVIMSHSYNTLNRISHHWWREVVVAGTQGCNHWLHCHDSHSPQISMSLWVIATPNHTGKGCRKWSPQSLTSTALTAMTHKAFTLCKLLYQPNPT